MTEQKKPQPGEWWRTRGGDIRFIVGLLPSCLASAYEIWSTDAHECLETHRTDGMVRGDGLDLDDDLVEHLPDCTGFNWQPGQSRVTTITGNAVETVVDLDDSVLSMIATPTAILVNGNLIGLITGIEFARLSDEVREKLPVAQQQIGMRVEHIQKHNGEPVIEDLPSVCKCPDCGEFRGHGHEDVCPMAWVEIDKGIHAELIPRASDVLLFRDEKPSDAEGRPKINDKSLSRISDSTWDRWKFVCRRKDLPPMPEPQGEPVKADTPDPGEGWRLLDRGEVIEIGDEWNFDGTSDWIITDKAGDYVRSGRYRRRITPVDPLATSHGLRPSKQFVTINLFAPLRVFHEPAGDYPIRCSRNETISDTATWVKVGSFQVEVPQ